MLATLVGDLLLGRHLYRTRQVWRSFGDQIGLRWSQPCAARLRLMSADFGTKDKPSTLASRPSFFGGTVSTRQASAVSTWKPPKATEVPGSRGGGSNASSKAAKQQTPPAGFPGHSAKPAAPAPPVDPILLKQQRLKASRNFDSDSDNEGDKSKPASYSQALANIQQQVNKQSKEAEARRPQKPKHLDSTQSQHQHHHQAAGSPAKQHAGKRRVVLPKGKAGAASRKMALAPQAISLSRKQMADRGIRQAVDSVRSTAPSPSPKQPPSNPPPGRLPTTQPGRPVNVVNRIHSDSNASSSGRQQYAVHASSAGRHQPPNVSRANASVQGAVRQQNDGFRPRPDAGQRPDMAQMPAWMQKAKAALVGQKRSRRDEPDYDDDFVVDDNEEEDWRQALKSVTRYDPSRYNDQGFDDRSMEANYRQIQAEERRSARLGRDDDARAEIEELRHQEEKKRKKKKAKANGILM